MRTGTMLANLLFSTLRIATDDGRVGTGAICNVPEFGGPFLVTNKHVVDGSDGGTVTISLADDTGPLFQHSELRWSPASRWIGHPDSDVDVTALPINDFRQREPNIYYRSVGVGQILTDEQTPEMDAVEEVWMVGYPDGIHDTVNNLPVVRRGITATPFAVDYEGGPRFLIDASVFPGSSGSPVYLYDRLGMRLDENGVLNFGGPPRFFFLGILGAGYVRERSGLALAVPTSAQVAAEMIDLGIVHKARTVVETIERAPSVTDT